MNKKDQEYYFNLPWSYLVKKEFNEGKEYYIVSVNEFPGVVSDGNTKEDAFKNIEEALQGMITLYLEIGKTIPEPIQLHNCKGSIAYRTAPERHYRLLIEAQKNHLSLSKFIDNSLDKVLGSLSK